MTTPRKAIEMFVVDTNIFMYAANSEAPEHARCRPLLEAWRAQSSAWFTTWGVLYEFMRVITHPRVLRRPWTGAQALQFVNAVLASPSLCLLIETPRHLALAREAFDLVHGLAGNLIHDAHIAILMKEHGIRQIYTRDTAFHRFPWVEVIDPLG
ncbi:MAG: type II toxin-antitoxin system VapC family toxin [Candidatus Xenobia bacterium]